VRSHRGQTFAFIVHPRSEDDMFRARALSLLRAVSSSDDDFVRRVRALPPQIIGDVTFGFSPFRGQLVSIGSPPLSSRGRADIVRAAQLAVDVGADVIGLGGLTSPATKGGATLIDHLSAEVTVTNGNAFTAAVLRDDVLEASDGLQLDRRPRVAVVGCTGSVGGAVSALLADAGVELILIGPSLRRVRMAVGELERVATFSDDLADVAAADVVLLVTSSPTARPKQEMIRAGAVLVDAAEPPNIPEDEAQDWARRGATLVRGGRVRIPGYYCSYDFGLASAGETFACLAETYLFACEGIREHSVGTPDPALADRLARVARRHGVARSGIGSLRAENGGHELVHQR
jgi:fatty aldehyde-generating acyl-ACP reductase